MLQGENAVLGMVLHSSDRPVTSQEKISGVVQQSAFVVPEVMLAGSHCTQGILSLYI